MAIEKYNLGQKIRVSGTYTVVSSSAPIDPSVVKLSIGRRLPEGTELAEEIVTYEFGVHPEIVKDSTGVYHALIDVDQPGTWWYRWWSTGTGKAGNEGEFQVRPAMTAPVEEESS